MGSARRPELADRGLLARWHHDDGVTLSEIARRVGCTVGAVSSAMRRHDLEVGPHLPAPPAELADEAWLRDQYIGQRRSIETIARLLHVSRERVRAALVDAGLYTIRRRPRPEPEPVLEVPPHWRFLDEG